MRALIGVLAIFIAISFTTPVGVFAQVGDGTLTGHVKDDTGGVLPGVTIAATSPAMIGSRTAVSDTLGSYRLVNLPPGEYVLTADLQGFAAYRQEHILMRAGVTFTQEIQMKLSSVAETVSGLAAGAGASLKKSASIKSREGSPSIGRIVVAG